MILPIYVPAAVAVGASVALAAHRSLKEQSLFRLASLWAVLALSGLVFAPVCGYLLWRYPAWSLMYLMQPDSLPAPPWSLALVLPGLALAGFLGARRLILHSRTIAAAGLCGGALLAAGLILYFGRGQLAVLGSVDTFRLEPQKLRSAFESPLPYLVAAASIAILAGWGFTLWRLILLGRVSPLPEARPVGVSSTLVPPEKKRRAGTRKKAQ